jgi:nucleoid DNA-binding protein
VGADCDPGAAAGYWLKQKRFKKRHCATFRLCYVLRRMQLSGCSRSRNINSRELTNMAKKGGAPTKSEILATISKDTELSRKQVNAVFESLNGVIRKSLRGHGIVTLPGLLKLKVVKKPATKARQGVNPFTGEKMMFKAKPASKKVRALPLKNLKSFVN